jgi:GNAT superfamily N-acetyltransferase
MNPIRSLILDGSSIPDLPVISNLPTVAECSAPHEHADARVMITNAQSEIIAHAALWWQQTPLIDGHHLGAIGGFSAIDANSAKQVLDIACDTLRERGCHIAVGPMNGNTWRRYRFVVESDGHPPFLLEPTNPAEYPQWWQSSGFSELVRYSSSRMTLPAPLSASAQVRERLTRSGVVIRPLDPQRYEDELRSIYDVSLRSFAANFLYTPLEQEAFIGSYLKVRDHADPRFIRIAERDGKPCGFVFGILDLNALQAGRAPALIVKTLAVDPQSHCAGLGSLLVDDIHQAAADAGITHSIHALQHESNTSLKITKRNAGEKFRQYALYQKAL